MDVAKLRNVALIGQVGAGKTSLGEALLLRGKAVDRLGKVDDGTSTLDFEPEEIKRRSSVSTAFATTTWKGATVSLLDTPGASVFLADAYTCLPAADAAVLVLDSNAGIRVQSERLAARARAAGLPMVVFLSKADKEHADVAGTFAQIGDRLGARPVLLGLPIVEAGVLRGVVDVLHGQAVLGALGEKATFDEKDQRRAPIPTALAEASAEARKALMEAVAETDDVLIEHYLENESLSDEDLASGFAVALRKGAILPVLVGSGQKGVGLDPLLDLIVDVLPSPADRPPAVGEDPKTHERLTRAPEPTAPFSGRVLKTLADPFSGRLTVLRVLSGTLTAETPLVNSTRDVKERIGQIFVQQGKKHQTVTAAGPGSIVAVPKLKETLTGDTLCDEKHRIVYPGLEELPPTITFALKLDKRGEEEKIAQALHRLHEEDPFLKIGRDPRTAEILLSGLGQAHVEVAVEKIERKFGLSVRLEDPKVPYRETLRGRAEVQGRHKRQTGGRGQFGDVWLRIEPLPRGTGFEFVDDIVGGVVPRQFIPAVEKGVREAMERGVYAGFPVVDVRVTLYDGSYHDVDSSEMAFKIAASKGFKKGFLQSHPVLLEPVVVLEISVPDECMGDINGDITRRRGRVIGVDGGNGVQVIKAQVPLAEVLRYAQDLKSMTADRGDFTLEPSHYEEVPAHVADRIVKDHRPAGEDEED